jgi:TonB family protein
VTRRKPPKPKTKPKVAIGTKKTVKRKPKTVKRKTVDRSVQETKALERRLQNMRAKVNKKKISKKEQERLDDVLSSLQSRVAKREAQEVARPQSRPTAVASSGAAAPLPSGASSGSGSTKLTMRQQVYNAEVESRIKRQWVLPEAYVKETSGLVAWVVLRIKRDGHLDKVWLEQSSSNSRFDQSCLRAVKKAAPFPTLPPEERGQTMELGIRFRPSDIG